MPSGPATQKHLPQDVQARKLFVGHIGGTWEKDFYEYFSKFGEIEDYIV